MASAIVFSGLRCRRRRDHLAPRKQAALLTLSTLQRPQGHEDDFFR